MQINKEKLKVIGGALIVLAAVFVMFNQVFNFALGIVRMVSMILIALAIAWFITNVMVRLRGKKKPSDTIQTAATSQSGELAAKKAESSDNESN